MEKNVKVTWTTISKPMDGLIATFIERRLTWLEAIAQSVETQLKPQIQVSNKTDQFFESQKFEKRNMS